MNVNLSNPLNTWANNPFKRKNTSPEKGGTFSNTYSNAFAKVESSQYVGNISPAAIRLKLEDEIYEYLSSNWNPNNMSQGEYDDFLDYLQSKGIISEVDKKYVCYGGERICGSEAESWYSPDERVDYFSSHGDALAYVRYQSSLIYEPETPETKREVNLYKKITLIMDEMVNRKASQ